MSNLDNPQTSTGDFKDRTELIDDATVTDITRESISSDKVTPPKPSFVDHLNATHVFIVLAVLLGGFLIYLSTTLNGLEKNDGNIRQDLSRIETIIKDEFKEVDSDFDKQASEINLIKSDIQEIKFQNQATQKDISDINSKFK